MKTSPRVFVWTPELAYIVGLLVTDGCLSNDGRHITLRSSDKDLLETFSRCLSLNNVIALSINNGYAKKPSYRIQFGDIQLYKWLMSIGLSPNKTHTIGEVTISDEYFRDFLRGHLDGDGTILTYIDKYLSYKSRQYIYTRLYLKFISASEIHIKWLHNTICRLTNVTGSLTKQINTHNTTMWTIKFAKKDSITLLKWMYYDPSVPSLQRKMLIANKMLQLFK